MLYNEHYQEDIMYITQLTRIILMTLGVWPSFNRKSANKKLYKFLLICVSYILLYCVLLPGTFFWLLEKRTYVKIQLMPLLLFGLMAISKYGNLIFREGQIKRCLKHIEEDWKNVISTDAREIMIKSAKTGRHLVALCGIFMYGSGLSFRTILPFVKGKIVNAQNITIKPLPCPGYFFFFNAQVSPNYEIIFALQVLSGLITFSITTGVCGLAAVFVMHACGQLRILMDLLKRLVDQEWQDSQVIDKKLAEIVEHQIRVRNFLRLVEETMQQVCLIDLMGCTIIVCIIGYCIIMEWEKHNPIAMCSYFITLTSMLINMFLFCYTGEQLTVQAEKVAITSCELEWYRLPDKKARGIVLVIIMSNLPTKITAGKIMDLSFKTYGDVVKTAVTYFNMLRNVVD
ncbi:odorant receptor 4-like isoform X2 [Linepithema humile]|uniref:odorant receptor 4-like isoform X2 n=1 Tax=Linepithema humile TaxID=83485 RepID=UPI00062364CC|nr:PREDICTED: odorant receptor 13a-like [Linepithema humile]